MEGFVDGISVSGDALGDAEGSLISGDAPEKKFMDNENDKNGQNSCELNRNHTMRRELLGSKTVMNTTYTRIINIWIT